MPKRKVTIKTLIKSHPRRNLPSHLANKRTETNFVLAFARSFVELSQHSTIFAARELPLQGYGIADLVCLVEPRRKKDAPLPSSAKKTSVSFLAFEMKMKDWRGALAQAIRYRYFANASIVVLPSSEADIAKAYLQTFKMLHIGLWTFDKREKTISEIYTPPRRRPISIAANRKALSVLSRHGIRSPQLF